MAYTTIDDPSEYFQTATYSGNSSTLAVVNDGNSNLQPDWVWVKRRNSSSTHALVDSSRGRAKSLGSEATDAEFNTSDTSKDLISFDTDGFTVGQPNQRNMNGNGDSFVAWQWKANGGTTTTNDASSTSIGNTDSVIQANTEAGFSIVTFSGTGSGMTVAHGLGGTPDLIISKARNTTENWAVHTTIIDGSVDFLRLSETDAKGDSSFSAPTSTVFGYNGSNNYVVYCFRSIKGYSKIGTYEANNSTDGTFVYTGFKPAWVLLKCVDSSGNWFLFDNKRDNSNMVTQTIFGDLSAAENTESNGLDFLSNGIKLRQSGSGGINHSGTYIYMCFASSPFVSSKGVPTTAR